MHDLAPVRAGGVSAAGVFRLSPGTQTGGEGENEMRVFVSDATRGFAHNLDDLRERWSIRKEQPTKTEWMPIVLFREDLIGRDRNDLKILRSELMEQLNGIKARQKIVYSRTKSIRSMELTELSIARNAIANHVQVVSDILSAMPKEHPVIVGRPLSEYFVDVAKETLEKNVFINILAEAKVRYSSCQPEEPTPAQR